MRQEFVPKIPFFCEIEFYSLNKTKNSRSNTGWNQLLRVELDTYQIIFEVEVIVSQRLGGMLIGGNREIVS